MAVTVAANLTTAGDDESITGWTADGNWGNLASTTDGIYVKGNQAIRGQVSQAAGHVWTTLTAVDLSNSRIYAWILPPGSFDALSSGGLRIVLGDGTNRIAYFVGGNDYESFSRGAWKCVVLDGANPTTQLTTLAGTTAISLTAITEIGIGINNPAKAVGNSPNAWFDVIRYGDGLEITDGSSADPGTFDEIVAEDASTANAYGIIREIQTGVYGLQGDLQFGNTSAASVWFQDDGAFVVIEDHVLSTFGTNKDINITVTGNTTGTTQHFELGIPVGVGDDQEGRSGVTWINSGNNSSAFQNVVFDAVSTAINELFIYGGGFIDCFKASTVTPRFTTAATSYALSGVVFERCGQVDVGASTVRNCIFTGYSTNTDAALLWSTLIDIKNCDFLANAGTSAHAIEHPTSGTFTYNGLVFSGNDYDINFSGSSNLTIDATSGADPATFEITGAGTTVTINNAVTISVTVTDEGGSSVSGAQVWVSTQNSTVSIINEDSASTGLASTTYNFASTETLTIRVRKASSGATAYKPFIGSGELTASGFSLTVRLTQDPVWSSLGA